MLRRGPSRGGGLRVAQRGDGGVARAARPRPREAPRTRRASRRSRRRACRPSRLRGARRRSPPSGPRLGQGTHAGQRLGELVGDVDAREPRDDAYEGVGRLVAEVERVRHDPDVDRVRLVEQRERIGERGDEACRVALRRMDRLEAEPDARLSWPRRPPAAGRRRRARVPRPRRGRRAVRSGRARTRGRRPPGVGSTCRSPRRARSGSAGPSIPGMASWRNDGTVGMQFDTESPAARKSAMFADVVLGQLELPEADCVESRLGVRRDVLGEGRVQGGDSGEGEPHGVPHFGVSDLKSDTFGSFATRRRGSGGFVSSLATR